jgi:hypothetical protein
VPGGEPAASSGPSSNGGGGDAAGGGLAGALASALAARKSKVSHSGKSCLYSIGHDHMLTNLQMTKMTRMIGKMLQGSNSKRTCFSQERSVFFGYQDREADGKSTNAYTTIRQLQSTTHAFERSSFKSYTGS